MASSKRVFICQSCGYNSPKWLGKCPNCGEWNSLVEEVFEKPPIKGSAWQSVSVSSRPKALSEITYERELRILTPDQELNRTLGGGIVHGSLILIGGEPGIGKSTLMLQIALSLHEQRVLYVSGEESEQQIKMRAERIGKKGDNCYILTETNTSSIFAHAEDFQPHILIIDSIQTLRSPLIESIAGSISQVRQSAAELMKYAKESGTPVFLIGHVSKDGAIAGPKVLEHMVDTVLQFEGERHTAYRILRTLKNRFGSTSELGIYEMQETGLRQVDNPSEILVTQREEVLSGVAIGSMMEGNRPLLIEIQSLVSIATYGTPQRSSTGFDAKRLQMLLAVLEKRSGLKLGTQDVFLNVAGGLRVEDPAIDLAAVASIVSSFEDVPVTSNACFCGEVGLGGEVRTIGHADRRIKEAEKLGYEKIYVSKYNLKKLKPTDGQIKVIGIATVEDLLEKILG